MKLYYSPGSCSLAPHILAREAGLPITLDRVRFPNKTTDSGVDYLSINPKGSVPAIELDGGDVLTENAVLLQYMAEQAPEAKLIPESGLARWRVKELLNFVATELHKSFSPLFRKDLTPEWRAGVIGNLEKKFDVVEKMLADKPYLTGDRFAAPDAYAFAVLRWSKQHNLDLSRWPKIIAYLARVAARPAVRQAMEEEGLPVAA